MNDAAVTRIAFLLQYYLGEKKISVSTDHIARVLANDPQLLAALGVPHERGPWWAADAAPMPKLHDIIMWPDLGGGGHMCFWRVTRVQGREWWMTQLGPISDFQGQFEYRGK